METPPAVWRIHPGADRSKVEDVLRRLAERLGIDEPEISNEAVMLPANYAAVSEALGDVEPGWEGEALLVPPEL